MTREWRLREAASPRHGEADDTIHCVSDKCVSGAKGAARPCVPTMYACVFSRNIKNEGCTHILYKGVQNLFCFILFFTYFCRIIIAKQ
jgi:hypothetical protein